MLNSKYIEPSCYEYEFEFMSPHFVYSKYAKDLQEQILFENIYSNEFTKNVRNTVDVVLKCLQLKSFREDYQIDSIRGISIEYGDGHRIICKNDISDSKKVLVVNIRDLIDRKYDIDNITT